MATATQVRKTEELKRDLFSNNDATVMRALNKCREQGTADMVEPLLALYAITANETFKGEISDMLSTLKVSSLEDVFMRALTKEEMKHVRTQILAFMWSSGVEPVDGVAEITRLAIDGGYDLMLEALTLIESIDELINEEILLESITDIKLALGKTDGGEKRTLMTEYLRILENKLADREEMI